MCRCERKADGPLDAADCSASSLFDVDMLKRAIMDDDAAEKFRRESKQTLLRDPETQAVVECYRHPDGRVLIASIRLPQNAPVLSPIGDEVSKANVEGAKL